MSQKKQQKRTASSAKTPVYRAIPEVQPQQPRPEPGAIGQAAIAAAQLHQLNRYAEDIQAYLNSSKMRSILTRVRSDMELDPEPRPRMRIRKD